MESDSTCSPSGFGQLIPSLQSVRIMDIDVASWAVSFKLFKPAEACVVRWNDSRIQSYANRRFNR